jgi:hypothetical protein
MSGSSAVALARNPLAENDLYDEEPGEEIDVEEDDLEKFLDEIRTAKNCVRCFNILLLLLGVGLTVFSFVGGELLLSLNWLAYAMSGLGISIVFVTLLGIMGSCLDMFNRLLVIVSACASPATSPPLTRLAVLHPAGVLDALPHRHGRVLLRPHGHGRKGRQGVVR